MTVMLGGIMFSQNQEQSKNFINKSIHSIYKIQKELSYRQNKMYNQDLKSILANQLMAIELYKKNDLKQALNYSYAAREKSMELLAKIGVTIPKETLMEPFEAEFFKKQTAFVPKPVLNTTVQEQLNKCDVLDFKQTSQFSLFILN